MRPPSCRQRAVLPAIVLAVCVALTGCTGDASGPGTSQPSSTPPVPLASLAVSRSELCQAEAELVATGLPTGSTSVELVSWGNGDPVGGEAGGDVAHEVGCTWRTGPKSKDPTAQVWVHVPPVSAAEAKKLRTAAAPTQTCESTRQARQAGFGEQPASWRCAPGTKREEVRWAGRFGDAWLTCAVTGEAATDRVQAFCTGVVRAGADRS